MTSANPIENTGADLSAREFAPSSLESARPKLKAIYFIILAAVAILPYLNSLHNGFVYDDFDQVLSNPYIRDFHHLREIFNSSVWSFMGDFRGSTNYYRPVMSLGYLLCYQIFGPRAWGFHLASLLANLGVVVLVFLVTVKLFRSASVGMVTAVVFALHPVHSEVMDWIAAVTELDLAFFYLLTFWFFLASARPEGKSSLSFQIAISASFVMALLSKEQALTLPLLAAVYEHFFREDRRETTLAHKLRRYGILWILPVVYVALRVHYLRGFAPILERTEFGKFDLAVSALALFGQYCWKLVWPLPLCAYYLFPARATSLYAWALRGAFAVAICALVYVVLLKFNRRAAFGMVWFLATLAPVLNVQFMASNAFAERYLYLASVGFCWIVGWVGVRAWDSLSARGTRWRFALPITASALGAMTFVFILARNRDWRDNLTFYTATLKVSPNAYYMHNNLGTVYWQMGNIPAAKKEWTTALDEAPGSEYILHNLGIVANAEKDYPRAQAFFRAALAIRPNYSDAHLDLGITYQSMEMLDKAETQFKTAEKLSPLNVRAHNTMSEFYLDQRKLDLAESEARRSVEIEPTTQGEWDLGLAEWMNGDRTGAERSFQSALTLTPTARAHFMLALFYMDSSRNREAIREYRAGLQLDPRNADAVLNLKKLEFLEGQDH